MLQEKVYKTRITDLEKTETATENAVGQAESRRRSTAAAILQCRRRQVMRVLYTGFLAAHLFGKLCTKFL